MSARGKKPNSFTSPQGRNALLDSLTEQDTGASAMNVADIQREVAIHYVVSEQECNAAELRSIAGGADGGPRVVDPVTFYDAARKVFRERSELLHRLAE